MWRGTRTCAQAVIRLLVVLAALLIAAHIIPARSKGLDVALVLIFCRVSFSCCTHPICNLHTIFYAAAELGARTAALAARAQEVEGLQRALEARTIEGR